MNRWIPAAFALIFAACSGCKGSPPSPGALLDVAPADLAQKDIIVDWPPAGSTVVGQWTAVTGWMNREKLAAVFISGAPVADFYGPTGHVGIPTVRVEMRADGRFIAPRVPVAEGATPLTLVFATATGTTGSKVVDVRGVNVTSVPATLIATPPAGAPGVGVIFKAYPASAKRLTWQWDFEGDGVFDTESETATHRFEEAGLYTVVARARENEAWLYATTQVLVGKEPVVTDSVAVDNPSLISVAAWKKGGPEEGDSYSGTRFVMVAEADRVQVFDPHLKPIATLSGLKKPNGMDTDDDDRIYVADSGNNRILRYLVTGELDLSFGTQGVFTGVKGLVLDNPRSVVGLSDGIGGPKIAFLNGARTLVECVLEQEPFCHSFPTVVDPKIGALQSISLARIANGASSERLIARFENALVFGDLGDLQDQIPKLNAPQITRAASYFDDMMGRWMAVDADGKLFEGCDSGARYAVPMPAALTAMAVDRIGSYRQTGPDASQRQCLLPVIVYVGYPGKLDRRQVR